MTDRAERCCFRTQKRFTPSLSHLGGGEAGSECFGISQITVMAPEALHLLVEWLLVQALDIADWQGRECVGGAWVMGTRVR